MGVSLEEEKTLKNILLNTFWEEIGDSIRPDNAPKKVYHYTSLEGLTGILSNKQIWMTNSNFLNDRSELQHFKSLTDEAKDLFTQKLLITHNDEAIHKDNLINVFIETFDDAVAKRFENPDDNFEVYVISLSDNDDSLTLWGNYAKGKGYSLCFDTKSLSNKVEKIGSGYMVYNKVIYNRKKQLEIISDALLKTFEILLNFNYEVESLNGELLPYFNSLIISYSIFFKHHSFEHEDEFRIAFTTNGDAEVFFRTNDEAIIPYIKVDFEDSDLKGVVIGPKNNSDLAQIGIQTYLEKLGYNLSNITVEKSTIPLRF